jgi:hypothetical protein
MLTQVKPEEAALRGQAVEMFAQLERTLDSVIMGYYTPRHPLATYLSLDMLSSESFSYGLRRDVFESIARRHGWYDDKRMQHLHKAGRWRNFLAHVAGMETHVYEGEGDEPTRIGFRDPKRPNKILTVAEAFDKFKPECEAADAYVGEVTRKVSPTNKFLQSGHVIENPIAEEDTYEAWSKRPPFSDADR